MKSPLRVAVIGLGGFAATHHDAVLKLEERGVVRLVGTCDPQPAAFAGPQQQWRFGPRGVRVHADYRQMLDALAGGLDLLVVPTPIHLHAEMHRAGVERGLAVYLEKPPTLDPAELDEMIRLDAQAPHATCVGFNFIIEPARLALKRRLLAGEFGARRETRFRARWGRPTSYFQRNAWAGRLMIGDRLVLDSCFGNALAHFVHNMFFWAGAPDLLSWGQPRRVQAELYRAHAIESADTCFVAVELADGTPMRFAVTHAAGNFYDHTEIVACERAELRYAVGRGAEVRWHDGRVERIALEPVDMLVENYLDYDRYLRGVTPRPATTLTDTQPFVNVNALAYVSSGQVAPIPPARVSRVCDECEQKDYLTVTGLDAAFDEFLEHGIWPSAQGWERRGAAAPVGAEALVRLGDTIRGLIPAPGIG